ncbi:hypothetical protein ACFL1G_03915 [Planctomycetota bacterium]
MEKEKLDKLLNELSDATEESPRPALAEEIKEQIPQPLPHHRGLDTISIIIDLRVSRLIAAAVIVITVILCASFLGGGSSTEKNVYQNSKELLKYWLGGAGSASEEAFSGKAELYKRLVPENKDVTYYGDIIEPEDSRAILMFWEISDGSYKVVFGDLTTKTVSGRELIKLHEQMLKKRAE